VEKVENKKIIAQTMDEGEKTVILTRGTEISREMMSEDRSGCTEIGSGIKELLRVSIALPLLETGVGTMSIGSVQ
jgi:hypothetical protein